MPSSAVRRFTDPDEYAGSLRGATVELPIIGRGAFVTDQVRVDLEHLWVMRLVETLPRIAYSANAGGRTILHFLPGPCPGVLIDGMELLPNTIFRYADGQSFFQRSVGASALASISFANEDFARICEAVGGIDVCASREPKIFRPPPAAMGRLKRIHAAAVNLAEHASEIIANPEAARGLEQEIIGAIVDCLAPQRVSPVSRSHHHRARLMMRFRELVGESPVGPAQIPNLCNVIGVTDRTLRTHCRETLGISPARYLWMLRMQRANRALHAADPATTTTVTDIATAHGFWELGRFAVQYKSLFGEAPSATLQRAVDREISFTSAATIPSGSA